MPEELNLLEMEGPRKKIVAFAGPDGVGKSNLAQKMLVGKRKDEKWTLVNGTDFESWDINEKEKQRLRNLQSRYPGRDEQLYGYLSIACHHYVARLVQEGENVIVDSEPTFKWLVWEEMRGNLDGAIDKLKSGRFKAYLPDRIIFLLPAGSVKEQADVIWGRLQHKLERSDSDPKSLPEVYKMLQANIRVKDKLKEILPSDVIEETYN